MVRTTIARPMRRAVGNVTRPQRVIPAGLPSGGITPESLHFEHDFTALTNHARALELPTQVFKRADLAQDDDDFRLALLANAFVDDVHVRCPGWSYAANTSAAAVHSIRSAEAKRRRLRARSIHPGELVSERGDLQVQRRAEYHPSTPVHGPGNLQPLLDK
jgi:hypothetical protein